jgi:hypothetical protein
MTAEKYSNRLRFARSDERARVRLLQTPKLICNPM